MTAIDKISKFAMAYAINGSTWTEFISKLLRMINTLGKIDKIMFDNEIGFQTLPMQQFLKDETIDILGKGITNKTCNWSKMI